MSYPSAKSWLGAAYFGFLRCISPRHLSHGLPVWTPLSTSAERSLIYERLDAALSLLRAHAPARYGRTVRSLRGFVILGTDSSTASYDPVNGICRLGETFTTSAATTSAAIACTVVHEATHAWLFKRNIGYDEPIRHRVELVCIKAALLAARKLPNAEAEVEECRGQMSLEPEYFSNEKCIKRGMERLRQIGCPEWFIRGVEWIARKRAA